MKNLIIDTPLGEVNFFVFGVTQAVSIQLESIALSPALPPGMSVQGCLGILLTVDCHEPVEDLIFECRLLEQKYSDNYYESGEHLIAHAWENEQSMLMIGTEDQECLNARLAETQQFDFEPVASSPKGISLSLPQLEKNTQTSYHFIAAWNQHPQSGDDSCWYAIDVRHAELFQQRQRNIDRT